MSQLIYYEVENCTNITIIKTGYPGSNFSYFERDNSLYRKPQVVCKYKNSVFLGHILNKSNNPFDLVKPYDLIEYILKDNLKIVCIDNLEVLQKLDVTKLKGIYKRQYNKDYKYIDIEEVA